MTLTIKMLYNSFAHYKTNVGLHVTTEHIYKRFGITKRSGYVLNSSFAVKLTDGECEIGRLILSINYIVSHLLRYLVVLSYHVEEHVHFMIIIHWNALQHLFFVFNIFLVLFKQLLCQLGIFVLLVLFQFFY